LNLRLGQQTQVQVAHLFVGAHAVPVQHLDRRQRSHETVPRTQRRDKPGQRLLRIIEAGRDRLRNPRQRVPACIIRVDLFSSVVPTDPLQCSNH
jgi:hypothetical protein